MDMSSKNNPSMQNIKDTTSNFNRKYKKKIFHMLSIRTPKEFVSLVPSKKF